jgi:hypothetical protein
MLFIPKQAAAAEEALLAALAVMMAVVVAAAAVEVAVAVVEAVEAVLVAAEAVTAAGASVAAAMRRYRRRLAEKDTSPVHLELPICYAHSQPSTQRVWNNSQTYNVSKRLDYVEVLRLKRVPKDATG